MSEYSLPSYVVSACRKGLKFHKLGMSGSGLMPSTVRQATKAVETGEWSESKIIKAAAWFARHESDIVDGTFDEEKPKPGGVAWYLWGSDPANGDKGRKWIQKKADKIKNMKSTSYSDPKTPAPPEDRIKGSSKNEEGSASTDGDSIIVSENVERALKNKIQQHNEKHADDSKRVTLAVLKKVYRRGAGAYSTSHRPNVSRAAWAMARVNAFLYLLSNGKPKNPKYVTDNDLLPEGHPMKEKSMNREGVLLNMESDSDVEMFKDGDIHVMRMGPLYDIESGEQILDLTPDLAKMIASTTNKVIESGHSVPMSLEHGIETGYRGEPGSDRRPYGSVTRVYYLEEDDDEGRPPGIYASKQWTALGAEFVSSAKMADGKTALRVSPRVKFGPAYHPTSGEMLGEAWFDVLAITTLPRQDSLAPLEMSRGTESVDSEREEIDVGVDDISVFESQERFGRIEVNENLSRGDEPHKPNAWDEHSQPTQISQDGQTMTTKKDETIENIVLLNRDTAQSRELFKVAGYEGEENIDAFTEHLSRQSVELSALRAEIADFKEEEQRREQIKREADVDALLADINFDSDAEGEFFRSSLLSDDESVVERARAALGGRIKTDEFADVEIALTEAKEAGSIPADFDADKIRELSRGNGEIVAAVIRAIPAGAVVRTGEAAGTDLAVEAVELSRDEAATNIRNLARQRMGADGVSLNQALRLVKGENPDLVALVEGVK